MRRLLLVLPLLLLVACGDDASDGDAAAGTTTVADGTTTEEASSSVLGDDPSKGECLDAARITLSRVEVPDEIDPSDGLDDEEVAAAEAELARAGEDSGFDLVDQDHPCVAALEDVTEAELAAMVEGIDPAVLALLGLERRVEFSSVGSAIEN